MPRMLRVQATRTFQAHTAGDVLLVEETPEIELLVRSKLFDVLAIESESEPAPPEKTKAKSKKKAAKNV